MSLFCYNLSHEEEAIESFKLLHRKLNDISYKYSLKNIVVYYSTNTATGKEVTNPQICNLDQAAFVEYEDKYYRKNFYYNAIKKSYSSQSFQYCQDKIEKITLEEKYLKYDYIVSSNGNMVTII